MYNYNYLKVLSYFRIITTYHAYSMIVKISKSTCTCTVHVQRCNKVTNTSIDLGIDIFFPTMLDILSCTKVQLLV